MARGWEVMSRFVCFLYSFKAAVKIVSKFVKVAEVDGACDIVLVGRWVLREEDKKAPREDSPPYIMWRGCLM